MSENPNAIDDEDLPEDLQPTEDNPLAQDLDPDEAKSRDELDVLGGKTPEQSDAGADEGEEADSGS
ncbi:hypothetical protein [Nocardioides sp.]|uniref:hypothetical protein n=1 Tax=Nocardioides sp. TaxID=35761 RepID=UPI003783F27F